MYVMSKVCSKWTRKKLCEYVFLYVVQNMVPHTGCVIVLLNYINVVMLPPLYILFAVNNYVTASSFPPAVILVWSLITAGAVLS